MNIYGGRTRCQSEAKIQYKGSVFLLEDPIQLLWVYRTACSSRETTFPVLPFVDHTEQPIGLGDPQVTNQWLDLTSEMWTNEEKGNAAVWMNEWKTLEVASVWLMSSLSTPELYNLQVLLIISVCGLFVGPWDRLDHVWLWQKVKIPKSSLWWFISNTGTFLVKAANISL